MSICPSFRFVTVCSLLKVLNKIKLDDNSISCKAAYDNIIKNTRYILEDNSIDFFKQELKNYKEFTLEEIKVILGDPILLWGMPDSPKSKYYQDLKFPVTKLETSQNQLRTFIAIHNTYEISNESIPEIIKLSRNEVLLNCKQEIDTKVVNRYILDHSLYFILLELDNKNMARVVKKIKLIHVIAEIDLTEPKKMIIKAPINSRKSGCINLVLESKEIARYMKSRIDEYPKKIINQQTKSLLKHLGMN